MDFDWNEKLKLYGNVEYSGTDNYKSVYNVDAVLDVTPIEGYTLSAGAVIQSKSSLRRMRFTIKVSLIILITLRNLKPKMFKIFLQN